MSNTDSKESNWISKLSLKNPVVWLIAIAIVITLRWDEINGYLDGGLDKVYLSHLIVISLVVSFDGLRNKRNFFIWLIALCISLAASYLLYLIYFLGGRTLINFFVELGEAGSSEWVFKYLFPIVNLLIWLGSRPSCKNCRRMFSSLNVTDEKCTERKFDFSDIKGNPSVKYKHTNKDGSPDKRRKNNVMANGCVSKWRVTRQCTICDDQQTTEEVRKTTHFTDFEIQPKYK